MKKIELNSQYKVKKLYKKPDIIVSVPGSKSMTNRALLLAALNKGKVTIKGVHLSGDSRALIEVLKSLGYEICMDENKGEISVTGTGGLIPNKEASVNVSSAGTCARFITALLSLSAGSYKIYASEQMSKRPMEDLYLALKSLGSSIKNIGEKTSEITSFPIEVSYNDENISSVKEIDLNIDKSSQFLSGLLMVLPLKYDKVIINLTGKRKARSYVDMTVKMMRQFGYTGEVLEDGNRYIVCRGEYNISEYQVEPDISAACYFYALAALSGGSAIVKGVKKDTLQGDIRFLDVLKNMGAYVSSDKTGEICVTSPKNGTLKGVELSMADFSDQALTVAAMAPFLDGNTHITGLSHIRGQESDRIKVISETMKKLGVKCIIDSDSFTIFSNTKLQLSDKEIILDTYNDHRVAMSFTILGLISGGIIIDNPKCSFKTFENFYDIISVIESQKNVKEDDYEFNFS